MKHIEPIPRSDNIQVEFIAVQTPPKRLKETHFLEIILPTGKKAKTSQKMCCAQEGPEKRYSALGQCCVYKDASRRIIHSSTSKPPASIAEIQIIEPSFKIMLVKVSCLYLIR
jgi:hypothetical protein